MRTKLIYSNQENHPGYRAGEGDTSIYALVEREES